MDRENSTFESGAAQEGKRAQLILRPRNPSTKPKPHSSPDNEKHDDQASLLIPQEEEGLIQKKESISGEQPQIEDTSNEDGESEAKQEEGVALNQSGAIEQHNSQPQQEEACQDTPPQLVQPDYEHSNTQYTQVTQQPPTTIPPNKLQNMQPSIQQPDAPKSQAESQVQAPQQELQVAPQPRVFCIKPRIQQCIGRTWLGKRCRVRTKSCNRKCWRHYAEATFPGPVPVTTEACKLDGLV